MRSRNVERNEAKFEEYSEILKVLREMEATTDKRELNKACLENGTLREIAGYDGKEDGDYNEYVRDFLDKLAYDMHNDEVAVARKNNDKEALKNLSRRAMEMAGYIKSEDGKDMPVNPYAKSFVDRSFMDKEMKKLYEAKAVEDENKINERFIRIYNMSGYSQNRPFGVVNEYAQFFVENNIDEFQRRGIYIVTRQVGSENIVK